MKEKTYACSLKNISCINLSSLLSINNYATIMLLGKYSATLKPIFTYIKVNCPPKEPRILLVHPSQWLHPKTNKIIKGIGWNDLSSENENAKSSIIDTKRKVKP